MTKHIQYDRTVCKYVSIFYFKLHKVTGITKIVVTRSIDICCFFFKSKQTLHKIYSNKSNKSSYD
jgi:hypothetical protein